jgi:hypothetical protein
MEIAEWNHTYLLIPRKTTVLDTSSRHDAGCYSAPPDCHFTMASQENNENFIKNVVGVRRRPNMTRKEFYDHHFRVHGYLSDAPDDKSVKPQ